MKARVSKKDSAKKRKLLKRKREPSSTDETNSEEFAVPSAKRSCQRRKKETIDACADAHGNVKEFSDFCNDLDDANQVYGSYRNLEEKLLELGDMYVSLDKKTPFLLNFGEPFWHFREALGVDGAPFGKDDEATAWLLSFLNVGAGMFKFAQKLVLDVVDIEKQIYVLPDSKTKAMFTLELIPFDMKWAALFSGELSNAAHFFSPFRNVSESNKCTVNGCLGPAETYLETMAVSGSVRGGCKSHCKERGIGENSPS
ncbi:hypothetical protein P5673_012289 [Acropora cervicornis]|uniref:Uncharacterized protein n=1 Tax=Acropora cervicornis TaxID=6130 RepID=A0AAD9QMP1_ACRCE|nr:hypothetical protein P5673_012289 [Acropora cervicornis]